MHVIYKLTNIINGKSYIGQSKQLKIRLYQHKKMENMGCPALYNAIKKYGFHNFTIEILGKVKTWENAVKKESKLIKKYNTLFPNGYNIKENDLHGPLDSFSRNKMSKTLQGNNYKENHTSDFVGVSKIGKTFRCQIVHKGNSYVKYGFKSDIEAAKSYDKMALFLFGKHAKLNFPLDREKYLKIDLKEFYNIFIMKRGYTSNFDGVFFIKDIKKWNSYINLPNKKRCSLGVYENEIDAAIIRDKAILFFKTTDNLAFPDKKEEFLKEDLSLFFTKRLNFKREKPKHKWIYKCFNKTENRDSWRVNIQYKDTINYLGYFSSEKGALKVRNDFLKKNFPEVLLELEQKEK